MLAAPAIVRPALLMPVSTRMVPTLPLFGAPELPDPTPTQMRSALLYALRQLEDISAVKDRPTYNAGPDQRAMIARRAHDGLVRLIPWAKWGVDA